MSLFFIIFSKSAPSVTQHDLSYFETGYVFVFLQWINNTLPIRSLLYLVSIPSSGNDDIYCDKQDKWSYLIVLKNLVYQPSTRWSASIYQFHYRCVPIWDSVSITPWENSRQGTKLKKYVSVRVIGISFGNGTQNNILFPGWICARTRDTTLTLFYNNWFRYEKEIGQYLQL